IKSLQVSGSPLDDEARYAIRQFLENPGNFDSCWYSPPTPPVVGIAFNGSPYTINTTQLSKCIECSQRNYTNFALGIVSPGHNVLIQIYKYDPANGDFRIPVAIIGNPTVGQTASAYKAYAMFPNGTKVLVNLTVSGG
ncbi:MAG: hypothetical protein ACPL09_06720, partial [Candidatus Methanodesulfokora sp.]